MLAGLLLLLLLSSTLAWAQDIEPRQYANTPIGFNFLLLGLVQTEGGIAFRRCQLIVAAGRGAGDVALRIDQQSCVV